MLGDARRPRQEDLPAAEALNAVLPDHALLRLVPHIKPLQERAAVVRAQIVHALDLEASALELRGDPPKRATRVRSWEHVLAHEQAPAQVFVLPLAAQPGTWK